MNKNYLVIGGNSAIGRKITERLSQSGSSVIVGTREAESLSKLDGVHYFKFNVLEDDPAKIPVPEVLQGLVYCPGTILLRPFNRLKTDDFLNDYRINVLGAVHTLQATIDALKKSETPSSVVLFSTVAVQTGMPFHASVASAKGAVEGLVRSLAAEYAPRIRFNAIAPSLVDTPMTDHLLSTESKREASAQRHPLKRVGTVEDIASAAVYLLSDDSSWISGQILGVDGGMSAIKTF